MLFFKLVSIQVILWVSMQKGSLSAPLSSPISLKCIRAPLGYGLLAGCWQEWALDAGLGQMVRVSKQVITQSLNERGPEPWEIGTGKLLLDFNYIWTQDLLLSLCTDHPQVFWWWAEWDCAFLAAQQIQPAWASLGCFSLECGDSLCPLAPQHVQQTAPCCTAVSQPGSALGAGSPSCRRDTAPIPAACCCPSAQAQGPGSLSTSLRNQGQAWPRLCRGLTHCHNDIHAPKEERAGGQSAGSSLAPHCCSHSLTLSEPLGRAVSNFLIPLPTFTMAKRHTCVES